jgi:hypothetical protein
MFKINPRIKFFIITFLSLIGSYFFALDNDFVGDDIGRILNNNELNSLRSSLTGELGDRPLLMFVMWIEKAFFGHHGEGFRVINLLFLALAATQLLDLILEVSDSENENKTFMAGIVAFIFALHPLHNQSINIAIQGGVVMSGGLGIFSMKYFYRWLSSGKNKHIALSALAMILAMLFKPIVSFIPLYFLVVLYANKKFDFSHIKKLVPHFLALGLPLIFYFGLKKNNQFSLSPFSYFLVQNEVLFTYFRLILFPANMKYLYDFDAPANIFWNKNLLYLLAHFGIIFTTWKYLRRKNHFILVLGFYLSFLPESSFFAINHLAYEHRTFFPLVFTFLFIGVNAIDFEVWKSKFLKTGVLIIFLSCIILNQVRNFQIKPMGNWLLHTIETSETHHAFNFSSIIILLKGFGPEVVKPMIDKYKQKHSDSPSYKVLFEIYRYYEKPTEKMQALKNISEGLKKKIFDKTQRMTIVSFFADELNKGNIDTESLMLLEKTLDSQMMYFKQDKSLYYKLIVFYPDFAKKILDNKVFKDPAYYTQIDRLRILCILSSYYEQKIVGLKEEVESALAVNPDSSDLKRCWGLVTSGKDILAN